MPKSKNVAAEPAIEAIPVELEEAPELVEVPDIVEPGVAAVVPSGRKALGGKEVIPFKWKLIGSAEGLALTLFKSVEREDADAQLERVRREGHYTDLRVLDVAAKVEQPKGARARVMEDPRSRKEVETPRSRKAVPSTSTSKPTVKRPPTPERSSVAVAERKPAKKQKAAVNEKSAKSKSTPAKASAKKPAKKK